MAGKIWMYDSYDLRKFSPNEIKCFIDIGANCGRYSIMIANQLKENSKVISIEPEKKNFNSILDNIKVNNLENVVPLKLACSDNNIHELKLYLSSENAGHNIQNHQNSNTFETVECKTIDTIVNDLKLDRVDLIKIDVEGLEKEVIMGSLEIIKRFHPNIICEIFNLKEIEDIVLPLGYKIEQINSNNYFLRWKNDNISM